jgi:hypothetical protein
MLNESDSGLTRVVTSLKVAALVVVLGSVVLAAEQRKATDTAPGNTVAAVVAPAQSAPGSVAQAAAAAYFPAQFAAPSGPVEEQPPTF